MGREKFRLLMDFNREVACSADAGHEAMILSSSLDGS
jgi:hypothetical protein